jgi:hypothetical protein
MANALTYPRMREVKIMSVFPVIPGRGNRL